MGDRISIQFEKDGVKSVALFSQNDGIAFKEVAESYVDELMHRQTSGIGTPLNRLEPAIVMVDFIRYLTKDMSRVEYGLFLGMTEYDGDNSDNGHYLIELENKEDKEHIEMLEVTNAMETHGGSFVQSLAKAIRQADKENRRKIKDTWPEYWNDYAEVARKKKQEEKCKTN